MQPLSEIIFRSHYIKNEKDFDIFVEILRTEFLKRRQEKRPPPFCDILAQEEVKPKVKAKIELKENKKEKFVSYRY